MKRKLLAVLLLFCCAAGVNASPIILANPHNLSIECVNGWGVESWPYWNDDTLETAYANGAVDISMPSEGVAWGSAENLVNGLYADDGLVMYDTWSAAFKLNESYNGGRTLGNDGGWGHALRIGISDHENSNRYRLEVYYSTVADPSTMIKLFEVQDLDPDTEWAPYCILVNTNNATDAITNIDSIVLKSYQVEQQNGVVAGGLIKEFNVGMVPEPCSIAIMGVGFLFAGLKRKIKR